MDMNPDGSIEFEVWSDFIGDPLMGQFCPVCKQPTGVIQVVATGFGDKLGGAMRIFVCGGCRFTASIGAVDLKEMQAELLAKALRDLG